jgi:endonuclease/exonuclease/phosphatase family metal-dependent hydrolase
MQSTSLKIISLNIEQDRHIERIIPFFKEHRCDAILLQEVLEKDILYLEENTGMSSIFTPLKYLYDNTREELLGMLTLSNLPLFKNETTYYVGSGSEIPRLRWGDPATSMPRAVLLTEFIKENQRYCLLNTHFTWVSDGKPNEQQHKDLIGLLRILSKSPEFILCGDFNSPRGTAIFDTISGKYKDNIPLNITSTIDKNLHKAGDLNLVVDGIFTTPKYEVESIKIMDNLSDHCAILAQIKVKAKNLTPGTTP